MKGTFKPIEFFQNDKDFVIRLGGSITALTAREARHLFALMAQTMEIDTCDAHCESCLNLGYLEVETDTGCEIQACQECEQFAEGSMGDWTNADQRAREMAVKEQGYKLSDDGEILG